MMEKHRKKNAAQWLGVFSALTAVILWIALAYANRLYPETITEGTSTAAANMVLLSALGLLAAAFTRPFLMLFVFLVSFIPVGLYLLGVPGWARLIGVANLLFAVSGGLILSTRYRLVRAQYFSFP